MLSALKSYISGLNKTTFMARDAVINFNPPNEEQIIDACVKNERWAQRWLYETYYGQMMSICQRYAYQEDEAQDLLHEGFIKIFRYVGSYKKGTSLTAWIRTIIVNTCIDYYRKKQRRRSEDIDDVKGLQYVDLSVIDQISAEEIIALVQKLSPAYRIVFNLSVIEGYSHKEIAEMLDINESTSRSNLVKARYKLQEMLLKNSKD